MQEWKVDYAYDNDFYEGAPREYECAIYTADNAQEAVNKCRSKFKPQHRLEIHNVYKIDGDYWHSFNCAIKKVEGWK